MTSSCTVFLSGNIEGRFGPENLAAMTPMGQFAHWFQEVCDHQPPIEQAKDVALATVDSYVIGSGDYTDLL